MKSKKQLITILSLLLLASLSLSRAEAGPLKRRLCRALQVVTEIGSVLSKTAWLINEIEYEYLDAIIQQDQLKENNKKVPPPPIPAAAPELVPATPPPAESKNESESQLEPPEILES